MAIVEGIGVVFGLLGAGVLMACCAWLAWWMLEPINRVAGELQGTTRFMLTDVLGLMILLQIGLAVTGQALSRADAWDGAVAMYWLLLGLMGVLTLVLWAASVSVVSRAGITRPVRRIAVMVLCVPGTLIIMVALPALIGFFFASSFFVLIGEADQDMTAARLALMAGGCVLLSAGAFALRWLAFWTLAGSPGGALLAQIQARLAGSHHPADELLP